MVFKYKKDTLVLILIESRSELRRHPFDIIFPLRRHLPPPIPPRIPHPSGQKIRLRKIPHPRDHIAKARILQKAPAVHIRLEQRDSRGG